MHSDQELIKNCSVHHLEVWKAEDHNKTIRIMSSWSGSEECIYIYIYIPYIFFLITVSQADISACTTGHLGIVFTAPNVSDKQ